MPSATSTKEIELIIESSGGGRGGNLPPAGGDNGDSGGGKSPGKGPPSPRRYVAGMGLAIISILMFFMALASAFLVLRRSTQWVPVRIPALLWVNTAVLLLSSGTLELARKRLARADAADFKKYWLLTTILGIGFLLGQIAAWRQLARQGVYLATNRASSFFYIFTGAHALHLLGGIAALAYVARRNFSEANVTRSVAAEVTSYYWHFLDALWLFLLALLYLGR
jgi:cytochrome c oxidase subunit 3